MSVPADKEAENVVLNCMSKIYINANNRETRVCKSICPCLKPLSTKIGSSRTFAL